MNDDPAFADPAPMKPPREGPARQGMDANRKTERNALVIAALAEEGATMEKVATRFGVSEQRIRQIRDRYAELRPTDLLNLADGRRVLRRVEKTLLAEKCEDAADRILDSINMKDLTKATLLQKAGAVEKFIDKALVLREEANVIMGTERRQKIDALLPALIAEARRRGKVLDLDAGAVSEVAPLPLTMNLAVPQKEAMTNE